MTKRKEKRVGVHCHWCGRFVGHSTESRWGIRERKHIFCHPDDGIRNCKLDFYNLKRYIEGGAYQRAKEKEQKAIEVGLIVEI